MSVNQTYKRDQVVGIINSVLGKIRVPQDVSHDVLSHELAQLKDIIEGLRKELHGMQVSEIGKTHIPNATDELDAVVGSTEKATFTIMDACEKILEIAKTGPAEVSQPIEANVVRIFEACTFQDITGQRIKKVMKCLKEIEGKAAAVITLLHADDGAHQQSSAPSADKKPLSLLNGPALPQEAVTQEDIDKLLAEFDSKNA